MLDSRVMQVQLCSGSGLLGMKMVLRLMVLLLLVVVQLFVTCGQPRGALCHGRDVLSMCGARLWGCRGWPGKNCLQSEMDVLQV